MRQNRIKYYFWNRSLTRVLYISPLSSAVADPGFSPGGGANSQKPIIFPFFCWKLHENERIWTPSGEIHRNSASWHWKLKPTTISILWWKHCFALVSLLVCLRSILWPFPLANDQMWSLHNKFPFTLKMPTAFPFNGTSNWFQSWLSPQSHLLSPRVNLSNWLPFQIYKKSTKSVSVEDLKRLLQNERVDTV